MSFNIRDIREISNDPLTKFVNQLGKKVSQFLTKNQTDKLENKEDIYSDGQDVETVIAFHDELSWTNKFDGTVEYFPSFEPDGQFNTLLLKGICIGNECMDKSGFDNNAEIFGEPLLMDGTPFDWGINVGGSGIKSTCVRYNRSTSHFVNEEYMRIPHATNIQVAGISTGISYFIRFRVSSIAQQGGWVRTLFQKPDNSVPDNGVILSVTSTGRLVFNLKRAGTEYNWETATSTIATDTVYEVWCTYAVSGNAVKIYVNNVDKSLSSSSGAAWRDGLSNSDLSIFTRGGTSTNGFVEGDFYDFNVYREKVVSATEVGRHFTNKWTIADIAFGKVMVPNYFCVLTPAGQAAYTTAGYTTTGYNT